MFVNELKHCENNSIAKYQGTVFFAFPILRVEQAPVSDHLTLISLIATYEMISSLKRPAPVPFTVLMLKFAAPVTDNFFRFRGVRLRELRL